MSEHFFNGLDRDDQNEELEVYRKKYPYFDIQAEDMRTNVTPIYRRNFYEFLIKHKERYWTPDEVHFEHDLSHYQSLSEDCQKLVDGVIAFFSVGDKLINDNIECNLMDHIPYEEARQFYRFKGMMEDVHATTYSRMGEHLYPDDKKRKQILDAVRQFQPVKDKVSFIRKYFNSSVDYPTLQVAEVCVELIQFAGSFAFIYYLKNMGKFPAICTANEWISQDEMLHGSAGAAVYREIKDHLKLNDDQIFKIVDEAVQNEKNFVKVLLPNPILGLDSDSLCEYIEYMGNLTLRLLGATERYIVPEKPFMLQYVDCIEYAIKNDFFNATSTQYKVSAVDISIKQPLCESF